MRVDFVDVIVGLQWGDEGKGKISSALAQKYDMVCRFNGGPNAGHTVYINDKKYKTHIIPCGIFHNKISIIGPNCVLNLNKFYEEINYLKENEFDISLIKVSPKAHIITEEHIDYDINFLRGALGTTGQGIAPAYADKMLRKGKQAKDFIDKKFLWNESLHGKILCEGAQSFWLDINFGNYPFVTSSETLPYSACSLGFSPKLINNIIGVAKIYDTKSGIDPMFPETLFEDSELNSIIEAGREYGTTTGRKRLVNWLNLDKLIFSTKISGCTQLIINKCDILDQVGKFNLYFNNSLKKFNSSFEMQSFIRDTILDAADGFRDIIFSGNKTLI
jgi:adenylosuccinate synthase